MMPAIETVYDGYRFRSRLEARWAVFFCHLGVRYQYEPEGFEWPKIGRYLPDFYLPSISSRGSDPVGVWLEVKPPDYVATEYDDKRYDQLVMESRHTLMLAHGLPPVGHDADNCTEYRYHGEHDGEDVVGQDEPMLLIRCHRCRAMRFEFSSRSYFECGHCPQMGVWPGDGSPRAQLADEKQHELLTALDAAKQVRFGT
jgi:hypothetical protein